MQKSYKMQALINQKQAVNRDTVNLKANEKQDTPVVNTHCTQGKSCGQANENQMQIQ